MSVIQKIAEIEAEMAKTQKNKATNAHLGILKAKLAKLRRELITPKSGGKVAGEGFDVAKTGDARVGFVGEFFFLKNENIKDYQYDFY
uniref:DRG2 n=1 Tax=Strongyloides papillosus TaxID=174720 RepID=A0A0N5CGJ8_STREA